VGEKDMINISQAVGESFKKREGDVFTFFIDKNFPAFEGHFPGAPLLPGIVQIEIALFCVKQILNKDASVSEIKKAKFIKPILPDTEIHISINENAGSYSVSIKSINEIYSQMVLRTF
jgi:3-hydroxyacyl-[acyl-carrier-protein] dehydratase